MKCLICLNPYARTAAVKEKAERLSQAFAERGVDTELADSVSLGMYIEDSEVRFAKKPDHDFCVYLDKDKYLDRALERLMPVFDCSDATEWCDDKTTTCLRLLGAGIKMPRTIPAPLCYTDDPDPKTVSLFLDRVESLLGYPMVAKEAYGSLGKQVWLIKDRKELEQTYERLRFKTHLYQRYIGEDPSRASDYRVITIGGRFVCAMKRVNDRDFRSNIGAGGRGVAADDMPDSFKEVAEKASKILKLDYAGIDLVPGKNGEPWFVEANSNAFFKEIEKVTKVDLAGLFADHVLSQMKAREKSGD